MHNGGRSVVMKAGMSRRAALVRLGVMTAGVAAAGCAPAAMAGRALYPEAVALDEDTVQRVLTAFAAVVIPEPDAAGAVVRCFAVPELRFAEFRDEFTADLMRRADQLARTDRFDRLPAEQRRAIVQSGIDGGTVSRRLYAAVFLTQVVYYSGIWNEQGACPFIGYAGAYAFTGYDALTWPDPGRFFPVSLTTDGNPA